MRQFMTLHLNGPDGQMSKNYGDTFIVLFQNETAESQYWKRKPAIDGKGRTWEWSFDILWAGGKLNWKYSQTILRPGRLGSHKSEQFSPVPKAHNVRFLNNICWSIFKAQWVKLRLRGDMRCTMVRMAWKWPFSCHRHFLLSHLTEFAFYKHLKCEKIDPNSVRGRYSQNGREVFEIEFQSCPWR